MSNDHDAYRTFVHIENRNHFGPRESLNIHIGRALPGDMAEMVTAGGTTREIHNQMDGPAPTYTPALIVSREEALALFVALNSYFDGGADDTRSLRRDYDAERARVDKMLDTLLQRPA